MKRLLILVAFFATLHASAQQVNPVPDYVFRNQMSVGRNAVTDTAAYFSIGPRYGATKGFMPPIVGDTATFSSGKRNGLLIFSVQKNKFLYWDSVRVQWSDMAGSSGAYIVAGDTASMLAPYLRKVDTTAMLSPYYRSATASAALALKLNISDTSSMLTNYIRHAGYGLTKSGQSFLVDTLNIATRAWRQKGIDSVASLISGGTIGGSGTTNYVPKFTASTTIGNSQIYDNGNIVGINTTSDAGYKLDVNGTLRSVNGANFATTSGNVGIGTTSPSGKLHVTGASANTSNIYTTTGFSTFTDNGFSSNGIRGLFVGTPSIGDNLSVAYFSFGNGEYPVSMQFYSGSDIGARGSSLIPYIFRTVGSSTVSALYNDGGAYFAQNVGIATSSPTQKLDINGRARIRTIDSTTSPINILTSDPTGIIRKTSISAFNGITGTGTNNYIAKFTSTGNIGNSLIFDNSINIGINTNSPKYFNHILYRTNNHSQYDSRYKFILESDTATYFGLATKNNTYAGYRILDSSKAVASFDYYNNFSQLDIYSAGITSFRQNDIEAFRIFTNGRIGINTTTDAGDYKLQVAGNIYNTGSITTGAPSGGSIKPWKIGEAATVSPTSPNRTIRVEIDGTVYYLHAKTTND